MDRRERKKKYKQTVQPMGIFQVRNNVIGKIFIGSGKNLPGNLNSQRFQLNSGTHMNGELQRDYAQLGEGHFSFEILDTLDPKDDPEYDYTKDLAVLEEMWRDKLQPYGEKGCNKKRA